MPLPFFFIQSHFNHKFQVKKPFMQYSELKFWQKRNKVGWFFESSSKRNGFRTSLHVCFYENQMRCVARFVQCPLYKFKECEKHPWKSVTFNKVSGSKSNTPSWVFFMFLKLQKWYQIAQHITNVNISERWT